MIFYCDIFEKYNFLLLKAWRIPQIVWKHSQKEYQVNVHQGPEEAIPKAEGMRKARGLAERMDFLCFELLFLLGGGEIWKLHFDRGIEGKGGVDEARNGQLTWFGGKNRWEWKVWKYSE